MVDDSGDPLKLLDRPDLMTDRERLAVEYTRAAQRDANGIENSLFATLRVPYTTTEIVELTAMIGLISMLNMFNNCLQITYHGEYESDSFPDRIVDENDLTVMLSAWGNCS
jgi:alkylhydroperoxidase family enzyme